ncbi:MAG: hypothetical protein DHS20C14_00600 [Phycisphaeraceae bacterium]|nr:MAG: hypothetical protein DHS20C14_00600 [Phycisphaeraceae bacterium]
MPLEGAAFTLACVVVAGSAVLMKEAAHTPAGFPALVATSTPDGRARVMHASDIRPAAELEPEVILIIEDEPEPEPEVTRWFDGRPVRPAGTRMMKVTAYSPDARSCGDHADGQTATLHSVWTNGMRLVAADTSVLPFGSMLTIPGYAGDSVVPVLDRGGAIKGERLDLLMPSHERARAWGVRELEVTVWEYADGLPAPDPRRVR